MRKLGWWLLLVLAVAVPAAIWIWKQRPVSGGDAGPERSAGPGLTAPRLPSLPADAVESSHPVERAVASGEVVDSRMSYLEAEKRWERLRLVKTPVQPGLMKVLEIWTEDADGGWTCVRRDMYVADQMIVRVSPGADPDALRRWLGERGMKLMKRISDDLVTVRLPEATLDAVPEAIGAMSGVPEFFAHAEADGVGFGGALPNDPSFSNQWGFHNTGQSGGTADADVDAPEFWDIITRVDGVRIAVLDSGLNFTHPDLAGVAWSNPGEIPGDGIDNDGNGRIDDVTGWDFVNSDNNPVDDQGHGSNVTGIIAATRNNSTGVSGMIGGARIISCKILNASNSGYTSDLIAGTTYARLLGASVMNLSLQNYPYNAALNTEFTACNTAGILLSICAGNQGVNNDVTPNYPSSYAHANIIAVGNHDRTDVRWSGSFNPSNYGSASVDLFAPGRDILSPVLGTGYSYYTGTSQACPFVAAVAAAIKAANPTWQAPEIKNCILSSVVTRPAYSGVCVTGGRLNAADSMGRAILGRPENDTDGDGVQNLMEYIAGTRIDEKTSKPVVTSGVSGGWFTLRMPRAIRPDAHGIIETSGSLTGWTAVGVTDASSATEFIGRIPVSGGKGFLRIRPVPGL